MCFKTKDGLQTCECNCAMRPLLVRQLLNTIELFQRQTQKEPISLKMYFRLAEELWFTNSDYVRRLEYTSCGNSLLVLQNVTQSQSLKRHFFKLLKCSKMSKSTNVDRCCQIIKITTSQSTMWNSLTHVYRLFISFVKSFVFNFLQFECIGCSTILQSSEVNLPKHFSTRKRSERTSNVATHFSWSTTVKRYSIQSLLV